VAAIHHSQSWARFRLSCLVSAAGVQEAGPGKAAPRRCWRRSLVELDTPQHAHDAISTIWKSTRSGPCRSTWKRRRRDSGKPGRLSSTSLGWPQRRGEWHQDFRIDVPIEPRLGEMVRTEGLLPVESPTIMRSLGELFGRGLGAEELGSSRCHRAEVLSRNVRQRTGGANFCSGRSLPSHSASGPTKCPLLVQ